MKNIDFKISEQYNYLEVKPATMVGLERIPNIKLIVLTCVAQPPVASGTRFLFKDKDQVEYQNRRIPSPFSAATNAMFNLDNIVERYDGLELKTLYVPLETVEESFRNMLSDDRIDLPQKTYIERALKLIEELKCNTK